MSQILQSVQAKSYLSFSESKTAEALEITRADGLA
jgi:hypothetical protein